MDFDEFEKMLYDDMGGDPSIEEIRRKHEKEMRHMFETFKCPICHKTYTVSDCVVQRVVTDRAYRMKGSYVTDILEKSINVRFCRKCAKKRKWTLFFADPLIFLIAAAIGYFVAPTQGLDARLGLFLGLIGGFVFYVVLYNPALKQLIYKVNIDKAFKDNAIDIDY